MTSGTARGAGVALLAAGVLALAGCASGPQVEARWTAPDLPVNSHLLRGARVLVACDVPDVAVRQLCQDRMGAELAARGAQAVYPPATTVIANDRSVDPQLLPAAREADARALLVVTLTPGPVDASPGFSIGFGLGSFGRHGGGGVGVSAPLGGSRITTGLAGNSRLSDARDGRLLWTARATTPPGDDLDAQLATLAKTLFGTVDKVGLF